MAPLLVEGYVPSTEEKEKNLKTYREIEDTCFDAFSPLVNKWRLELGLPEMTKEEVIVTHIITMHMSLVPFALIRFMKLSDCPHSD